MKNKTETFLGDRSTWRDALIVLDDMQGPWGGRRISVRGDGAAVINLMDLEGNEDIYAFTLDDERTQALFEQCRQADVLSATCPARDLSDPGLADESASTVFLVNAAGEKTSVTHWTRDDFDPRFEAVRAVLDGVCDGMQDAGATLVSTRATEAPPALPASGNSDTIQRDPARVLESLKTFFREDDWAFEKLPDRPLLRLPFQGKSGRWNCFAQVRVTKDLEQVLFYSVAPVSVPEEQRSAVAEFITRANYAMALGNFELDFNDGEVRFKTSLDVTNVDVTLGLVKPMVYTNCLMMDKYLPGLMSVMYTDVSPEEAVRQIEGA